MPKLHSLKDRPLRALALVLVGTLVLLAAACGGGGGDDNAKTAETSQDDAFTIWAPKDLQPALDRVLRRFKQNQPDIAVDVVYGEAADLNDRILVGEKPDVYISTAKQIDTLLDDKTVSGDTVDIASDQMQIIVPPGNPKQIDGLSAFGLDPLTTVGLCRPEVSCGRTARNVLANARVTATPDSSEADAKTLISKVANSSLDAGMVFRTEAAKAVRSGTVETVDIPSQTNAEITYRLLAVRPGKAVDAFKKYIDQSSSVEQIWQNAGLAPLPAQP